MNEQMEAYRVVVVAALRLILGLIVQAVNIRFINKISILDSHGI